jgi:hypothetical protein
MAFPPLLASSLPNVLLGPLLRDVSASKTITVDSQTYSNVSTVSVMLFQQGPDAPSLKVYKSNGDLIAKNSAASQVVVKQIGAKLYVVNATFVASTEIFSEGELYYYNLSYGTNSSDDLSNASIFGMSDWNYTGPVSINGVSKLLPSFSIPPSDLNKLKIIHSSCRKPHGPGNDMLAGVDKIITESLAGVSTVVGKANAKPHLMFLTGDQIYSDDVAHILLFLLNWASTTLVGPLESIAITNQAFLKVGKRYDAVKEAKLTADEDVSANHLVRLAEFFMMYLFTWNNNLWPTSFPTFNDVFPGVSQTTTVYSTDQNGQIIEDEITTPEYDAYTEEMKLLPKFVSNLPKVRKVMANIPNYMILDDHEVTDDLFLNKRWCTEVLATGTLGEKIITNGLAAYAIFQAWGNDPFNTKYGDFLNNFGSYTTVYGTTEYNSIKEYVLPVQTTFADEVALTPISSKSFEWNFTLQFSNFEIIVLNTRSRRGFSTGASKSAAVAYAHLISNNSIPLQITSTSNSSNSQVTFLVFPSPPIGKSLVDALGKFIPAAAISNNRYKKRASNDNESLIFQKKTFHKIFARIVSRSNTYTKSPSPVFPEKRPIIILGGDVHFAYSARMSYWMNKNFDSGSTEKFEAVLVNLTASALKNQSGKTKLLQRIHIFEDKGTKAESFENMAWSNVSGGLLQVSNTPLSWYVQGSPGILDQKSISGLSNLSSVPDWLFRVDFINGCDENIINIPTTTEGAPSNLASQQAASANHKEFEKVFHERECVGFNNFGVITIQNWNNNQGEVIHELVWDSSDAFNKLQKTRYEVSLNCNDSTFPIPHV